MLSRTKAKKGLLQRMAWRRELTKTISWMLLGFGLFYVLTGDLATLGVYFGIRTIMYYSHEYLWGKTTWGKA